MGRGVRRACGGIRCPGRMPPGLTSDFSRPSGAGRHLRTVRVVSGVLHAESHSRTHVRYPPPNTPPPPRPPPPLDPPPQFRTQGSHTHWVWV